MDAVPASKREDHGAATGSAALIRLLLFHRHVRRQLDATLLPTSQEIQLHLQGLTAPRVVLRERKHEICCKQRFFSTIHGAHDPNVQTRSRYICILCVVRSRANASSDTDLGILVQSLGLSKASSVQRILIRSLCHTRHSHTHVVHHQWLPHACRPISTR